MMVSLFFASLLLLTRMIRVSLMVTYSTFNLYSCGGMSNSWPQSDRMELPGNVQGFGDLILYILAHVIMAALGPDAA